MKKVFILCVLFLTSCVDVRPDSSVITTHELDAVTIDSHYANVKIECGKSVCESKKQYCFKSTKEFPSDTFLIATCLDRPAGCADCTCMRENAQKALKGSKNCKGDIHCSQDDSQVTVTCVAPKDAFVP